MGARTFHLVLRTRCHEARRWGARGWRLARSISCFALDVTRLAVGFTQNAKYAAGTKPVSPRALVARSQPGATSVMDSTVMASPTARDK